MIVSASRRADIPAHYAPWFMNRARAGFAAVPNPFNPRQVARVEITPATPVVFWTRNPAPLLDNLDELAQLGLVFYFNFTLLDYPLALHPAGVDIGAALDTFLALAGRIGPERVLWRYDPIVLSTLTPPSYHRKRFATICRALSGATRRVTVSLMEPYRKGRKRLAAAGVDLLAPDDSELADMFVEMAETARACGITPASCACDYGLERLGFVPGACVDAVLIRSLFGRKAAAGKDPHQRKACGCAPSRDIGMYDACPAGCVYCYATRDFRLADANRTTHDPASPSMLGRHEAVIAKPRRQAGYATLLE